jgi:hypothetical protein
LWFEFGEIGEVSVFGKNLLKFLFVEHGQNGRIIIFLETQYGD